jgi:hypothetical protein
VEGAREDGADHRPGVGELEPGPLAVGPARPARVEQPHVRPVLLDALGEHARIHGRGAREERPAEAGAEVGLGLLHARLGPRELRRVPVDEVVRRLRGAEPADGWDDAERVRREEDHVRRVPPDGRDGGARDELDGVGDAGVLCDGVIVEVGDARPLVEDHVLQDRAEADRVPDLGLALARQPDALGVAPTLEVEDPAVGPAVLVVADERPLRVGRERRLAGPREPEEEGDAVGPARVRVRRAVHGEDARLGHVEVHGVEDALLDLAGVLGAEDDDEPARQRLRDEDGPVDAELALLARGEPAPARVEDGPVRAPLRAAGVGRIARDEEGPREEGVPGLLRHHADAQPVARVRPGEALEDVGRGDGREVLAGDGQGPLERSGLDRAVHVPPPDAVVDLGGVLEELVGGAAARPVPGRAHERAVGGESPLAGPDGPFDKVGGGEVSEQPGRGQVQSRDRAQGHRSSHGQGRRAHRLGAWKRVVPARPPTRL